MDVEYYEGNHLFTIYIQTNISTFGKSGVT